MMMASSTSSRRHHRKNSDEGNHDDASSSSSSSADEFLVDEDYGAAMAASRSNTSVGSSSNSCTTEEDDDEDRGSSTQAAVKLAHTANAAAVAVGGAVVWEIASQCDEDKEISQQQQPPQAVNGLLLLAPEHGENDRVLQAESSHSTTKKSVSPTAASSHSSTTLPPSQRQQQQQLDRYYPPRHWPGKCAVHMARHPCGWLGAVWAVTLALSVVGIIVGDFQVAVDNAGWTSRGTLIADRTTQMTLILDNLDRLTVPDNSASWDDLLNTVQGGWESDDDDAIRGNDDDAFDGTAAAPASRRRMQQRSTRNGSRRSTPNAFPRWNREVVPGRNPAGGLPVYHNHNHPYRFLQQDNATANATTAAWAIPGLAGCDTKWYTDPVYVNDYEHLWPVWKPNDADTSALEGKVIRDICLAEINTQTVLRDQDLCYKCSDGQCLPPYSLVLFARLTVGDGDLELSCDELATEWDSNYRTDIVTALATCVADMEQINYVLGDPLPESCPLGFHPAFVDEQFSAADPVVHYTSTIYMTKGSQDADLEALWDAVDLYDRATTSDEVTGAYDTQYEYFVGATADEALVTDMSLALGSALVTGLAILVHTRSMWLTVMGLLQIIFSFPLAYFVYNLVAQLEFFPFLNFIGVFVVFAIGADDIFVAVDKWKNARLAYKNATAEQIAAIALPDAAEAMFLTSITTAVAFFGSAICPVAPLKLFAIFNGLLVMFDYFLCVVLIFPSIILYDKWVRGGKHNVFVSCHCCHNLEAHGQNAFDGDAREEESESLIRRLLAKYYGAVHAGRFVLVAICVGATIACGVFAATLGLPDSSDVRLLDDSNEHEKCYEWRLMLLSTVLVQQAGSRAYVIWGVVPADTGNHNNPDEFSQLVLDGTFDPSSGAAQEFLLDFCPAFFGTEFAEVVNDDFQCSVNKFDAWLMEQSSAANSTEAYRSSCGGASGLPMPEDTFDACIVAWSQLVGDSGVLQRDGVVEVIVFPYQSRVRYDSKHEVLGDEWKMIESWLDNITESAPTGVKDVFQSSEDYWWYDTNGSILVSAYGSAAIALAAAAIVMLISSRSFEITLFAIFTILFILLSVTALLVASGWTLGFLESVCFSILIGVSCDFVIHFSHAYSSLPGEHSRHERSKFAVIQMGPSILAGAFTTIAAATVMIFTVISFFQKFAQILFYTVIMASVGAFVVFITLSDAFGPSRPTVLVDAIIDKLCGSKNKGLEESKNGPEERLGPLLITRESERVQL